MTASSATSGAREPERTLVARAPAMQEALARLEAVARFDTPVLLTGESGTGKELLAQRLHRLSPRGQRALIAINCGALPAQLVESALFGHEAGAFTGASKRHRGVFERADRGTPFLDEIGELRWPCRSSSCARFSRRSSSASAVRRRFESMSG